MPKLLLSFWLPLAAAAFCLAPAASAVNIQWRTVGDPGNTCDPQAEGCFGSVAYTYQISRFEVTNNEYRVFLNAVAAADPNGLYNVNMATGYGGITRSGVSGSYTYNVLPLRGDKPVNYVSFYDALRFANWLHNGQATGAQSSSTTEDGAYTITAAGIAANSIVRNSGARVVLPSEDEWHKAAYYFYSGYYHGVFYGTGYTEYPAGSDSQTTCAAPGITANTANCANVVGDLTNVGSYTNSPSFWGSFDQAANVWEWNDDFTDSSYRTIQGGSFVMAADFVAAAWARTSAQSTIGEISHIGFRVARQLPVPFRVQDIVPGGTGSTPYGFTNVNGTLFFVASDAAHGNELWKSDGTASGTVLVKDIFPGTSSSDPYNFTNMNGTLFFVAVNGTSGSELWKSDGTAAGTVLVKDIRPGANGSSPEYVTNMSGTLFFAADNGTSGYELWKSNGTTAGTVLVKDIYPGATHSYPYDFTSMNGALYFQARDVTHGFELWKSNGTAAGTVLVKDIALGISDSNPANFIEVDGTLFFQATDGIRGSELWKSDGTAAGTVLVKEIYPGAGGSNPSVVVEVNGTIYFVASDSTHGYELWKTDGTAAGTALVRDINLGEADSYPTYLTNLNGTLFFRARDDTSGAELWKSDGTTIGTALVKDIWPGANGSLPYAFTTVNGTLFFTANDGTSGTELWKSDGTVDGTVLVQDIWPGANGSQAGYCTDLNGTIFFRANDGTSGSELWAFAVVDSDGDGLSDEVELQFGSNPYDPDTDDDALVDALEIQHGTDAYDYDSDDDGLGDGYEVLVYLTEPLTYDTDGDGFGDGWEVAHSGNPTDPASPGFEFGETNSAIQASDQPRYRWRQPQSSLYQEEFIAPPDLDSGEGVCSMYIPSSLTECNDYDLLQGCILVSYGFDPPPPDPPTSGLACCPWEGFCELTCEKNTCAAGVTCPPKDDASTCQGSTVCVNEELDCASNQTSCNTEQLRLSSLGVPACCFESAGAEVFQWSAAGLQTPVDSDLDRFPNGCDNCPTVKNPDQKDNEDDTQGDACDTDDDNDGDLDTADNCPKIANSDQADQDGDGVGNLCDNCLGVANLSQVDTNHEGFGNICDADYDDDGGVGLLDFGALKMAFGRQQGQAGWDPELDHDGDGVIGLLDFGIFRSRFGTAPGPSGLSCAGVALCPPQ